MNLLNGIAGLTATVFALWVLGPPLPASAQAIGCFDAELVKLEANYILDCQYWPDGPPDPKECASGAGAINNIFDAGKQLDWVVPRENALAILGLVRATRRLGDRKYLERAQGAMDYLVSIQASDGGWFNQYERCQPSPETEKNKDGKKKSPTQTAEVMIAMNLLGYQQSRYQAMIKAAEFLLTLQDPANKTGVDDGLLGAGIDPTRPDCTPYCKWRWASDNAFAYQALRAAAVWAGTGGQNTTRQEYEADANRIRGGIDRYLKDPRSAVWHVAVDEQGNPACLTGVDGKGDNVYQLCSQAEQQYHEWINYAPQMLDVPANGVGNQAVGEWIHTTLVRPGADGVAWDDGLHSHRLSPGYSFQASLVWLDLDQWSYRDSAWSWATGSGLHQVDTDQNGIKGGWIDWTERPGGQGECVWSPNASGLPPCWQRFIDTSFYAIASATGGFDFLSGRVCGDCDGSDRVTVNEITQVISSVFESCSGRVCGDCDGSGSVTGNELTRAISNFLGDTTGPAAE